MPYINRENTMVRILAGHCLRSPSEVPIIRRRDDDAMYGEERNCPDLLWQRTVLGEK